MSLWKKAVSVEIDSYIPAPDMGYGYAEGKIDWENTFFYGTVKVSYFSVVFGGYSIHYPIKNRFSGGDKLRVAKGAEDLGTGVLLSKRYKADGWYDLMNKFAVLADKGSLEDITYRLDEINQIKWVG